MTDTELVDYDQLDALIVRLQLGTHASELHGSLCGYLAGAGSLRGVSLLDALQLEGETEPPAADQALLAQCVTECEADLADSDLGFEPLLPADDRPLDERAEALVQWCRGFLGGFGLAGAGAHAALSDEAKEMLHDLAAVAGSAFEFKHTQEDEDALMEVHEFVRIGALLLHTECTAVHEPASGRLH